MNQLLLIGLVTTSITACGILGDSDKSLTSQSYCEQRAEAECTALVAGCTLNPAATAACNTSRTQDCLREVPTATAGATGSRKLNQDNAKACIAETKKVFSALMDAAVWKKLRQSCARTFEGDVQINAACTADLDCSGGLICDKGVCGTSKVVPANAACSNPGETCSPGQFCAKQPTGFWACTPRFAQGADCDAQKPCLETLRCADAKCQAALGPASRCSADADCAAPLICDPVQLICAAAVNLTTSQCEIYKGAASATDGGIKG